MENISITKKTDDNNVLNLAYKINTDFNKHDSIKKNHKNITINFNLDSYNNYINLYKNRFKMFEEILEEIPFHSDR